MKEKPILFSGEMVLEILAGHKTQTRRVIKIDEPDLYNVHEVFVQQTPFAKPYVTFVDNQPKVTTWHGSSSLYFPCPYGQLGDLLWVRETWRPCTWASDGGWGEIEYRADYATVPVKAHGVLFNHLFPHGKDPDRWRPSIHMPRWASRITLRVTGVRVERVQDISWSDSYAEGIHEASDPQGVFGELWDSINAKRGYGWDVNPWVWVVEFELVRPE